MGIRNAATIMERRSMIKAINIFADAIILMVLLSVFACHNNNNKPNPVIPQTSNDSVIDLGNGIIYKMLVIPGDTFQMGSLSENVMERPVHKVKISAFRLGVTEVTQEQYQAIMGTNPSAFDSGGTYPVERVSWCDAVLFCNALSKKCDKDTVYSYSGTVISGVKVDYSKNGYRMPTEAEWEYACRGITTTDYYWGKNYPPLTDADTIDIDSNSVWKHNSEALGITHPGYGTHPVGTKKPNAFGLYDMNGNVGEWVNDWYGNYTAAPQTDPSQDDWAGVYKILRGGCWNSVCNNLRSACREYQYPDARYANCGLRIACRQ